MNKKFASILSFSRRNSLKTLPKEGGQAVLIAVLFFVFISLSLILAISAPVLSHMKASKFLHSSVMAMSAAESGAEDVAYRLMNGFDIEAEETVSLKEGQATVSYSKNDDDIILESKGVVPDDVIRKIRVGLQPGVGINFAYAIQVGNGGLILENSASVKGNVFSIGSVEGGGNEIDGSVIVADTGNYMRGIEALESAHAFRLEDSHIHSDAYYMEIDNTTVMGDMNPDTEPAEPVDLPITEETVDGWKEYAEDGDVINCNDTYVIDSEETIGPAHITCDLEIRGNPTVTLEGHVWVEGDIEFKNSPTIKISDSLGDESVVFLADDPADRIDGSTISLGNNPTFEGAAGSDNSFLFMVSMNEAAAEGGSAPAMTDGQKASGDVFMYTEKGEISVSNNIDITGLTAYRIRAKNSAVVEYQDGLSDTFFSASPLAGLSIFTWREIK
ncbi:MAG: hypothetical protein ACLFNN_01215 [Candidatus Paceibacterota bacterium]